VERRPSPEGSFGKGRHLGCSGTHSFFAEGCGRRPFSRRSESASRGRSAAQAERRQVGSKDRIGHSGRRGHGPATGGVRANRVGAKLSVRASAARGAGDRQARAERSTFQPLTRDNSASSLRKGLMNRLLRVHALCESRGWRSGKRVTSDPSVVLVDRFGCRSRRAARGVVRSRAKSSRKRRGLALPHCSEGRKSVGSRPRVAKPGVRWRVRVRGGRESDRRAGNSSREGASVRGIHLF
jgi:hypothetical protein